VADPRRPEVATVADDSAVVFWGPEWKQYDGLEPDTDYALDGVEFRTLARPNGERLATFATVNDVHFGETVAGREDNMPEVGPQFSSLPGEPPYPETMNGAAVEEMAALEPDAVLVKGDLTADGRDEEYADFLRFYQEAFGDRLFHIRGNHDAYRGQALAPDQPFVIDLPGARLAVLDTTVPFKAGGAIDAVQLAWLEDVAYDTRPRNVLVFGHHHVWSPGSKTRPATYFGVNPDDSERLIDLFARTPILAGYFAGHTHRNRVRRFPTTGDVPWVEVACVKDFPGAWAEYRVFEGGVLQVFHRIRRPDALSWTERTRAMFNGLYQDYAFGTLADRCFAVRRRSLPDNSAG
jgi:Icc protein